MTQKPVHPGQVLFEEYLKPRGIAQDRLAMAINVPVSRIESICWRRMRMSPETCVLVARYLGTSPEFWARLQWAHDLHIARRRAEKTLSALVPWPGKTGNAS